MILIVIVIVIVIVIFSVIIISSNDSKNTVDGRNSAPAEGKVVYPIIYKGFIHFRWCSGYAGFLFTIKLRNHS